MELELKHIEGYLHTGLKIWENGRLEEIIGFIDNRIYINDCHKSGYCDISEIIPALFPVSSLTENHFKELDKIVGFDFYCLTNDYNVHFKNIKNNPYYVIEKLYEWNIDIHGLIPLKIAIDINTLNNDVIVV